ncbi:MAG: SRPBCC family protein [bacterium]
MSRMTVVRTIAAPAHVVFRTVADITQFAQAVPEIVKVEFLSDVRSGVGTRFRETRAMNGKHVVTELAITEFVDNERVRMVAESHGTVWDTTFTVKANGGQVILTTRMDAMSHNALRMIFLSLINPLVKSSVAKNMDAVKLFCER